MIYYFRLLTLDFRFRFQVSGFKLKESEYLTVTVSEVEVFLETELALQTWASTLFSLTNLKIKLET
jgi:hypothetical protein